MEQSPHQLQQALFGARQEEEGHYERQHGLLNVVPCVQPYQHGHYDVVRLRVICHEIMNHDVGNYKPILLHYKGRRVDLKSPKMISSLGLL